MKKLLLIVLLIVGCEDEEPENVGLCVEKYTGLESNTHYWRCNDYDETLCELLNYNGSSHR